MIHQPKLKIEPNKEKCRNDKKSTYRSISKAAVLRFSYNLSFNPRTTFCVSGKRSFSAIVTRNRNTFVRFFHTAKLQDCKAVFLQAPRSSQAHVVFRLCKKPVASPRYFLGFRFVSACFPFLI